ncbi:MAG TPA: hypothetical protein VFQ17_05550 [Nocardioides sp.]|nr:hypothetical protein [Nocardioides sp.]
MTQLLGRGLGTGAGRASSPYGWSLVALAGMLVLNSLLGPLLLGVVDYPISASMTNQLLGLEVVTLVLVVPWAAMAGALALRQDPRAPLLALGPTTYAAYMFVQYVLGPEYGTYSWVVLFHVAIVALSGGLALLAWSKAQRQPVPSISDNQRRRLSLMLAGLAVFVLVRYLPAFSGAVGQDSIAAEFRDARTFFWSIVLLDLAVVVPLTAAAALALLRDTPVGHRALYGVVGWFALVPPSVTAMAAVMLVRDDPHASVSTLLLLAMATLVFWAVAGGVLGRLVRGGARPAPGSTGQRRPRPGTQSRTRRPKDPMHPAPRGVQ